MPELQVIEGTGENHMQPRMKSPATIIPEAMEPFQALNSIIAKSGLPEKLVVLVHLRASQINGCSACVFGGHRQAKRLGETEDRISTVAAWREAPFYTDAERAALDLTEAVTRLSDRSNPVSDELWEQVSKHFQEPQLAALLLSICLTNVYNRMNVSTRQIAGQW
jgi:AhpD family alkylhydroperoxidase